MTDIINDMGLSGNFWNTVRDFLTGGVSRIIQVNTDTWSKSSDLEKRQLVKQALVKGVEDVIYGDVSSVEAVLREVHSEVESDETWKMWYRRNSWIKSMVNRAESEAVLAKRLIEDGKRAGYESVEARISKAGFEYADPYLIRSFIQPNNEQGLVENEATDITNASVTNGVIAWAKMNTPLAIGVGIAAIGSMLLLANLSGKEKVVAQSPKKVGVLGIK